MARPFWKRPELALALVGLGSVLWFTLRVAEQTSPGPLTRVHAALPELEGAAGCDECHGSEAGIRDLDQACLSCHETIGLQIATNRGLHGRFDANHACGTCHAEHKGPDWRLVQDATFARLGFATQADFDHSKLDFGLRGAHDRADCQDCHPHVLERVLQQGKPRFGGLSNQCVTCHDDVHEGQMGVSCEACHGQELPFAQAPEFTHAQAFPLTGGHAEVGCSECHPADTPWSVEAGLANPPEEVRGCVQCHATPHASEFELASARLGSHGEPGACVTCHTSEEHGFTQSEETAVRLGHSELGFPLEHAHGQAACADCHESQGTFAARFQTRTDCADCHADPHGSEFTGGTLALVVAERSGCVRCHAGDAQAWAPAPHFDHGVATGVALEGAHAELDCSQCHGPGQERRLGPVSFPGQGMDCARCHDDPHLGLFDPARSPKDPLGMPGQTTTDCASCHNQTAFIQVETFDHGMTGMELTGAHLKIDCRDCHLHESELETRLKRALPPDHFGQPNCVSCHPDPHAQRFDRVGLPTTLQGRTGCERCHTTESFHEVSADRFDHSVWTDFALEGAHQQVRCTTCHGQNEAGHLALAAFASFDDQPVWQCAECHSNPHGQTLSSHKGFQIGEGRIACDQCHHAASFRSVPKFDHGLTGFPLEEKHAQAQCVQCHKVKTAATQDFRLHGVAGTDCADCHSDPHLGQFGKAAACADCHRGSQSFAIPAFDHDQTAFPLDKAHAKVACTQCHKEATTQTGLKAIRYKPLGTRCADCHGAKGKGSDQ